MAKIRSVNAKKISDSRGNPTIEVELETNKGKFSASVPSGASKGKYEALELKDKDGKGVKKAISNIKKIIAPALKDKELTDQREIDEILIKLDGTENKSKLGANAILPVSIAVCRAGAAARNIPLYQHINEVFNSSFKLQVSSFKLQVSGFKLPFPCFNVINGGAHSENQLQIQEFMIIPQKKSFAENFKTGSKIYQNLKEILIKEYGENSIKLGDEGGFSAPVSKTKQALYLLAAASKDYPDTKIGLDCAASHFFENGKYNLDGESFTREGLLNFYQDLINTFPIIFLEDPYEQEDWEGWRAIISNVKASSFAKASAVGSTKSAFGQTKSADKQKSDILIIGDDLTVTNQKRIKEARDKDACSGVIIKPNQIGTIIETLEAVKSAKSFGWKIVVSHRSGETKDDFIADLAVGVGADFIKSGSGSQEERMVKYNRLLEIESELK